MGASVPPSPPPASLVGDVNSGAARDSLVKALKLLPQNVARALHHEPVQIPGEPPSGGPSALGKLLLALRSK